MDAKQLEAIKNIRGFLEGMDRENRGGYVGNDENIWPEFSSWEYRSPTVTIGDLRAIAAIAPPVAAGSVDTPAFRNMLATWSAHNEDWRIRHASESMDGIIAHINAWAAQHVANAIKDQMERAEKAEADLKARDFFVDVLNCQVKKAQGEADVLFHRLNAANGHLAMARERIEELETEIKVLHQG